MSPIDPTHQLLILARLAEFTQYRRTPLQESDPWAYMRRKLQETEEPLTALKAQLLRATGKGLLEEIRAGALDAERCADYKHLFERLLTRGDFADLAIHLSPGQEPQEQARWCEQVLSHAKPSHLFVEERMPDAQRSAAWDKMVGDLGKRLDLDLLEKVLTRKPRNRKRRAYILRRLRRNVAEYCSVVRIPTDARDTFTPFMLPRVEALIAACLRFLDKYR